MAVDIGHGASFKRGNADGPPETYTAIAPVVSISGPSMSKDVVDVSSLSSTDRYREFISGMRDGGEVTIEIRFDPADADVDNALTDFEADAARSYQIAWADGSTFAFEGILTAWSPETPYDDAMSMSLTYKVTGAPTFTASS